MKKIQIKKKKIKEPVDLIVFLFKAR